MVVLRSLLFVPGNRANMLEKALGFAPDAYVPDMEDSVPAEEKANARDVTASFLARLATTGRLVVPRVNSIDSGLMEEDLEAVVVGLKPGLIQLLGRLQAVVGPHIFGVSVGKVRSADDIKYIAAVIERLERRAGVQPGGTRLVPWLEVARAIVNAYEICVASPRIVGVAFGAEDFTNDMGIPRTEDDSEVAYPRSVVCVAARAADVLALDTPYFGFRDPEGLRKNALAARRQGFKGKFAIHPAQVDIINEAFSPSEEEIQYARRVVAAFDEAERQGRGSTSLDGKVIDVPVVKRARQVLEVAKALGRGV